jgi:translation initiation factor 5
MALNVNRNVQDAFYRYKMPRLVAKVEGKGNGVKTVIPNMPDIARALGRPPTYCTKYFGCELGAQTQFDFKNERYIVNGSHEAAKLQDLLDGFIKKFVLCAQCENPETVFKVNGKRGVISSSCKACGHVFQIDMRHKLTTFILKNPPNQQLNSHGTSLTKKKEKKSKRKDDGEDEDDETNGNSPGGGDKMGKDDDDDWGDDDDDWCEDVSEEAVKQRQKELTSGIQGLTMDDDLEKTETERINIFHNFVKAKIADGSLEGGAKEVLAEAERLEVTNKAPIVLCELLFTEAMVQQIKKHKKLFLRFTHENQKAQKYLLGGVEKTIEAFKEALLSKVPVIMKTFYDEDIIDEEVILEWGKKASKKYVSKELSEEIHKKAEPFLTWLKEAEEESSDEDDEENVELTFDERAKISSIKEQKDEEPPKEEKKTPANNAKAEEDDEDDLDIDDI